jgi:hypothetical protein
LVGVWPESCLCLGHHVGHIGEVSHTNTLHIVTCIHVGGVMMGIDRILHHVHLRHLHILGILVHKNVLIQVQTIMGWGHEVGEILLLHHGVGLLLICLTILCNPERP